MEALKSVKNFGQQDLGTLQCIQLKNIQLVEMSQVLLHSDKIKSKSFVVVSTRYVIIIGSFEETQAFMVI